MARPTDTTYTVRHRGLVFQVSGPAGVRPFRVELLPSRSKYRHVFRERREGIGPRAETIVNNILFREMVRFCPEDTGRTPAGPETWNTKPLCLTV